ncbi:sideroflexin-2 isoform X2 [Phodopus roborovskii]|uniref:sideroflexin-2 isoform X2 n=1 Tax=Phodopus roborovskii TaxID=109678 RepID=UPI0021E3FE33|nr:sideroflexin-2 isoform X2 [Phodopus roborovskii]
MEADLSGFNIDAPRWDQSTFLGRVKHFFNITDPRTAFASEQELDWARLVVEKSRMGLVPPGTQVEQLLYAKKLYDSAFHPDTGEKMNIIGRMSFQVPGGMIITGFMLQFYRTMPAVIFWQWVNQSFNALVNYTNRNAASPTSVRQMALSYFTATTTAVATAVGMNMWTKGAHPGHLCEGQGSKRAWPFSESCSCGHHPSGYFSDHDGSTWHGLVTGHHGAAGETASDEETQSAACPAAGPTVWLLPPLHGTSSMWALPSGMQITSFLSRTRAAGHHQGQVWRTSPLCLL